MAILLKTPEILICGKRENKNTFTLHSEEPRRDDAVLFFSLFIFLIYVMIHEKKTNYPVLITFTQYDEGSPHGQKKVVKFIESETRENYLLAMMECAKEITKCTEDHLFFKYHNQSKNSDSIEIKVWSDLYSDRFWVLTLYP